MLWVFLAVLSHFFWGWANIFDKYIIENKVKNPYVYVWWQWLLAILAILLIPLVGIEIVYASSYFWLIVATVFSFLASIFYIKALQLEEVSRIGLWWNLIPFFVLIIGWFTIGQKLSGIQFVAFLFLVSGAFVGSVHAGWKNFRLSKAIKQMLLACITYSLFAVAYSYVVARESFVVSYIWINIFGFFMTFFFIFSAKFRKDFTKQWKNMERSTFSLFFGASILNHLGAFFNVWALSLGLAALVFAMEGMQAMFIFVFATAISIFRPKFLKENLDKKNIILKLVALVFMVIGIIILNLG
jgi:drug/metabolite transporter (DMT)-like permease